MFASTPKIKTLVVDSNAIITGAILGLRESVDEFYTIDEVYAEIRDGRSRTLLAQLPFEIRRRQPDDKYVTLVHEFAKKTGDLFSLSRTDLQLLALSYQFHAEEYGDDTLRTEPPENTTVAGAAGKANKLPVSMVECRFYKSPTGCLRGSKCMFYHDGTVPKPPKTVVDEDGWVTVQSTKPKKLLPRPTKLKKEVSTGVQVVSAAEDASVTTKSIHADSVAAVDAEQAKADVDALPGWNEDEDEESEWVGPSPGGIEIYDEDGLTFKAAGVDGESDKLDTADASGQQEKKEAAKILTGIITTDYAMQNVALQAGLKLIAHSGKVVTCVKSWVLSCDSCYAIIPLQGLTMIDMKFCNQCGNATLSRLGVTLGADGKPRYHFRANRVVSTRGTIYPLPAPKGGRLTGPKGMSAAQSLILTPDQLLTSGWKEKLRQSKKEMERESLIAARGWDDDSGSKGFGGSFVGPYSSMNALNAAVPFEVGWGKQNPNSNSFHKNRRRKK